MRLALASGTLVLLVVTVLCAIGALLAVTLSDRPPGEVQFILSLALAIPLLLTLPLLVLPRARYRRYRWRVDEDGIEIHRGIWWRSRIMVPRNRLQHTDVAQGPLERRLGLARLIVHTAGTHNASTTLEALSLEAALGARALLADDPSVGDGT